jgi:hypothetical protein
MSRLPEPINRIAMITGRVLLYLTAIILPVLAFGYVTTGKASRDLLAPPPAFAGAAPQPPVHDPAKPTVAIIASMQGTEITDLLAPYEVFATTEAFNV